MKGFHVEIKGAFIGVYIVQSVCCCFSGRRASTVGRPALRSAVGIFW